VSAATLDLAGLAEVVVGRPDTDAAPAVAR
jgi:hypothetical protein